ncbi:endonuclease/exonuclease/phosphatase family protein [Myxococcota bacterium]|nr:endonuclease/exonuclease/phosphatase family protein [Myxococcota bacterium]MBU1379684.1 endonuclease/exonuclease/phosphatase family protein [Myxococcota bacterium]MBU1496895.1 endonuclease/exonuclease/phosphatase family protein [Myxococcota bacterium]
MLYLKKIFFTTVIALSLSSCDPFNTQFEDTENAVYYESDEIITANYPGTLKVMTWNVKFGGGRIDFYFDCHGDRVLMDKQEVINNMSAVVDKINQVEPDILLIQEVDVLSKRSAYVNQVKYILKNTSLNYAYYASQWKADFVPSDGLGRVDSGNAILSKYPLSKGKRLALPLIGTHDSLTSYFYLKRNILMAVLTLPDGKEIDVLNIHTAAYSKDGTKKKQIDIFHQELKKIDEAGRYFIAGGDLNAIPPGSLKTSDFPDSVCTDEDFIADDYSAESAWLDSLYADFSSAVPLVDYQTDNSSFFTHTTDKNGFWNRKLDYIWTNGSFALDSYLTHQDISSGGVETMLLSDHAPLTVVYEVQ